MHRVAVGTASKRNGCDLHSEIVTVKTRDLCVRFCEVTHSVLFIEGTFIEGTVRLDGRCAPVAFMERVGEAVQ